MLKSTRIIQSGMGVLLSALMVVGCGGQAQKGNAPAGKESVPQPGAAATPKPVVDVTKKEKLKVAYSASTPNLQDIQLYAAQEKGIYAKYGLDVEITLLNGVTPTAQAVISGDVDLGFLDPTFLLLAPDKGQNLKAVVNTSPIQPYMLVARPSVKELKELNGKRIGVSQPGTLSQTIIQMAMAKQGIKEQGIQWVAVGGSGPRYKAMISDRIDAGIVQIAHSIQGQKENPPLKVIADLGKELPDLMGYPYVAKQSTIDQKRSAIIKFVAANLEATRLLLADKETAVQIHMKYVSGLVKEDVLKEYEILKAEGAWNPEGDLRATAVSFTAEAMVKDGLIKVAPKLEQIFAQEILNAAKEAMKQVGSNG